MSRRVKFETEDKNPQNMLTWNVERNKKREKRNKEGKSFCVICQKQTITIPASQLYDAKDTFDLFANLRGREPLIIDVTNFYSKYTKFVPSVGSKRY